METEEKKREAENKKKGRKGKGKAVPAFKQKKGMIVVGGIPLIWKNTREPVPCERCQSPAVAPILTNAMIGEIYFCPEHHSEIQRTRK